LNLLLQPFDHPLILPEGLFQPKMPVEIAYAPDQDPYENRTENDQKERNTRHFPQAVLKGVKPETKNDFILILERKKDDAQENDHPENRLRPFHFFRPPF
jgi:hypothetical protein